MPSIGAVAICTADFALSYPHPIPIFQDGIERRQDSNVEYSPLCCIHEPQQSPSALHADSPALDPSQPEHRPWSTCYL